jgi:asparagine synthase (glutamine-hydrolysing)
MQSADRRYVITFNGEIYNYRDIRRELEAAGRFVRGGSDTEVLLEAWPLRHLRQELKLVRNCRDHRADG